MMNKFIKENNIYKIKSQHNEFFCGVAGRRNAEIINSTDDLAAIRKDEKKFLSDEYSLEEKNILFLNQVHEDKVFVIDKYPEKDEIYIGDGDGIVTNLSGVCPVIRTADCVPVFLYDKKNRAVGAVHSGWRSTKLGISVKACNLMKDSFGTEISEIEVFILPSIGPDSYEVQMDVAQFFEGFYDKTESGYNLDLWSKIESDLIEAGVKKENIFNTGICSLINKNDFYTHRGGDKGRNLNFCYMR